MQVAALSTSIAMSTATASTVGIAAAVITVGSLVGLWLTPSDYNDEGTKETGLEGVDPTTPISDLRKLVEVAVKSECQKYRKENEATNDLQIYQKGEVEQVLTAELLNAVVEDKVTQVFGKYIADLQEKIDNIEGKLDLQKNEDVQKSETTPEHSENNYLKRLKKLEGYIQKKDPNPSAKYVERIYAFLSPSAFKIKEIFRFVTEQAYSSFPNNTNVTIKDYSGQNMWAGQLVDIIKKYGAVFVFVPCCCYCIYKCIRRCCDNPHDDNSTTLADIEIYKKLENSLCVISFSKEYVASYHLPLARSLTEYMYQGKHGELSHIKKVTITKPDNLNSVPPSKVFIVCVDYNEGNDILEPDSPNKKGLRIRRETVRSLVDRLALVILVYFLEKSSENLGVGDRYAYKLHSKIVAVEEAKKLDEKNCIFSVYKKLTTYQLGALKQTVGEYLKMVEEIVS